MIDGNVVLAKDDDFNERGWAASTSVALHASAFKVFRVWKPVVGTLLGTGLA